MTALLIAFIAALLVGWLLNRIGTIGDRKRDAAFERYVKEAKR